MPEPELPPELDAPADEPPEEPPDVAPEEPVAPLPGAEPDEPPAPPANDPVSLELDEHAMTTTGATTARPIRERMLMANSSAGSVISGSFARTEPPVAADGQATAMTGKPGSHVDATRGDASGARREPGTSTRTSAVASRRPIRCRQPARVARSSFMSDFAPRLQRRGEARAVFTGKSKRRENSGGTLRKIDGSVPVLPLPRRRLHVCRGAVPPSPRAPRRTVCHESSFAPCPARALRSARVVHVRQHRVAGRSRGCRRRVQFGPGLVELAVWS